MRLFGIWDGIWDLGYGWDWDLGLGWDFGKWEQMGWDMGWDGIGDSPIPFNMGGKYTRGPTVYVSNYDAPNDISRLTRFIKTKIYHVIKNSSTNSNRNVVRIFF
ncbi:hypothetical protein GLOIN_2v1774909 [Rhizophagus irregularis DAOM 181602=DAOM 197198]|uniref:Uncharacterized protein n=1 Tax=Rhizophagus irregularis (strain DAOM 197198w) TaxID=1432141 RepID=A0A015KB12_RHIIW|nr:hypothetical protein RirG_214240 [Rhizophagus irregularis DAOM 197198w]GBC46798.1 hypothetical protein GLOIN_2v1774909 [Rhizophagus irregularis DAOM 181602=DAOM 197198]